MAGRFIRAALLFVVTQRSVINFGYADANSIQPQSSISHEAVRQHDTHHNSQVQNSNYDYYGQPRRLDLQHHLQKFENNKTALYEFLTPFLSSFLARTQHPSTTTASQPQASTASSTDEEAGTQNNHPYTNSRDYSQRDANLRLRLMNMLSVRNESFFATSAENGDDAQPQISTGTETSHANVRRLRELFAMPPPMRHIYHALYALIFITALAGNSAVIVVYRVARSWRQDISVFHVNLAIADILLAVFCVPFTAEQVLDHFWSWPNFLCPIVLFLQPLSVHVSVYTLVVIGIDRWKFVRHPLQPRICGGVCGKVIMCSIWGVSSALAAAQLSFYKVAAYPISNHLSRIENSEQSSPLCECKLDFGSYASWHLIGNLILTYIIPSSTLIVIYLYIGRLVWLSEPPGVRMSHKAREQIMLSQKKRIVASLFIIVTLFALAWLPLHLFIATFRFLPENYFNVKPSSSAYAVARDRDAEFAHRLGNVRKIYLPCHVIGMTSTCINPFVYAFLHASFRNDCRRFLLLLKRWLAGHRRAGSGAAGVWVERQSSFNGFELSQPLHETTPINNLCRSQRRNGENHGNGQPAAAASNSTKYGATSILV